VQLTLDLTLEPTSTHYAVDVVDLTDTPGWKAADFNAKTRILDAAVRFLHEADPQNDEWFRTLNIPYAAIAGFRALALLMVTQDARLVTLSKEDLGELGTYLAETPVKATRVNCNYSLGFCGGRMSCSRMKPPNGFSN
jgi:hypothetical protein